MKKALLIMIGLLMLALFDSAKSKKTIYVRPPYPKRGYEAIQEKLNYPEIARAAGIEGSVFLEVVVGASGKVNSVKVVTSLMPELDRIAKETVRSINWKPATTDGKPIASKIEFPVFFQFVDELNKERRFDEDEVPKFRGFPVVVTGEKIPAIDIH